MNWPHILSSPATLLARWTALLALGWFVQWFFRHRHARWRVILWRSILCFGFLLPIVHFPLVPGFQVRLPRLVAFAAPRLDWAAESKSRTGLSQDSTARAFAKNSESIDVIPLRPSRASKKASLGTILLLLWALGFAAGSLRLGWLQFRLSCLKRRATLPDPDLQRRAAEIRISLGVHQTIGLRLSDAVKSPFVSGPLKPVILLPRKLAESLSPAEVSALIRHEMAHVRENDLFWCLGWRWMSAVYWFHPLVWKIPSAHNLGCEQEADRIASGNQFEDRSAYGQLLAQLALRVMALPTTETYLTLNASSQIARRLIYLRLDGIGPWTWRNTVKGFVLAGGVFLVAGGSSLSLIRAEDSKSSVSISPSAPPAQPGTNLWVSTSPEYHLQVNDWIRVQVSHEPDLEITDRISPQGTLHLGGLLGRVNLRGMTVSQAEALIAQLYKTRFLVDPHIKITMRSLPQSPKGAPSATQTAALLALNNKLDAMMTRLDKLRTTYRDGHPAVIATLRQIDLLRAEIDRLQASR